MQAAPLYNQWNKVLRADLKGEADFVIDCILTGQLLCALSILNKGVEMELTPIYKLLCRLLYGLRVIYSRLKRSTYRTWVRY